MRRDQDRVGMMGSDETRSGSSRNDGRRLISGMGLIGGGSLLEISAALGRPECDGGDYDGR